MAGKAAEAFRGTVNDLPDLLDRGQRSLRAAGEALHGWQADLEVMQRQAAELESRAEAAKKRAERAERNPDLGLAGQEFPDEQSLRNAQARLDAAVAELNAARNEVAEILEQAKRLHAQHTEIAEEVARALRKAQELAPDEPGLLERIGSELGELLGDSIEAIGDALGELASGAWQLVKDNANLIANLADLAADLSVMVGLVGDIVGLVPPNPITEGIAMALGGASLVLQVGALGGHALARAAGGDVPDEVLAADALGVVTGTVGMIPVVGSEVSLALDVGQLAGWGVADAASGGELTTFFDDLQDYWVPKNPAQMIMGPAAPLWNAIESGIEEDQQAKSKA